MSTKEDMAKASRAMGSVIGNVMADTQLARAMMKLVCQKLGITAEEIAYSLIEDMDPEDAQRMRDGLNGRKSKRGCGGDHAGPCPAEAEVKEQ